MIAPEFPKNEKQRQAIVEKFKILDTLSEDSYDNITSLMAFVCDAPISLITLLDRDRNFLKSHYGIPFNESPRELSFCGHAIHSPTEITIIEDARKDHRFHDNPLVTEQNAIFYAGAPLVDSSGVALGTLCVYDTKPRTLKDAQKSALIAMSKQVMNLLELRYQNISLLEFQEKLKIRNHELEKFAHIVSHDLKSPLNNIVSLTELLASEYKEQLHGRGVQYLEYLKTSSHSLREYINGLLKFYKSEDLLKQSPEEIEFSDLVEELIQITDTGHKVHFNYQKHPNKLVVNKAALLQVFTNVITNAIKYNHKSEITIDITTKELAEAYLFKVQDNGDGIPQEYLEKIFTLFLVVGVPDRDGNLGTGIGLATVKKIVEFLGGEIKIESKTGIGSTFTFSIGKVSAKE